MTDSVRSEEQARADALANGLVPAGEFDPGTGDFAWYEGQPVGVVIGRNVKRLRSESALTQHELAQVWKRHGLSWARSKLASLEAGGRPQVSVAELILMAIAMRVPITEFFAGPPGSRVALAPYEADTDASEVATLFSDQEPAVDLTVSGEAYKELLSHVERVSQEQSVQADVELAQRLGIHPKRAIQAAFALFDGRSLTTERDRRVERMGAMTVQERQAHRGHVTRELSALVEKRIAQEEDK
ncbi:hypothetical protein GCM10009740_37030 [Terrabacter terrae]|uniref:HTH cro/C1-type domain-containing protein n=1 Tax=Terrabacter terrae TaxID=318434 RepID=A0ABP5GA91_9MICO